ncbi:MAG: 3-dehydroquinate synthase [Coriobacteriales bacterium]|nr:3-dehydroquinate synthase [Coriobacteriales bacterium]
MSETGTHDTRTQVVPVRTPSRSYNVHVGCDILHTVGPLVREAAGGDVAAVMSDSNVGPLYAQRVIGSLESSGYRTVYVEFAAGERNKRFATLVPMLEQLAQAGLSRKDVVVAVGGGVCGDMAGLAAALYQRGIQVAQVPTSLLAMVDSSVGGKTAVDLEAGKNLAGAFLQPSVVVADVTCLHTLSPALLADSCGEVIKHGVLADPTLFSRLEAHPITERGYADEELARVVAQNVAIKRNVVNADEREQGVRQTLNLGHTLGHAIEAASDYQLGHGSSVAAGLCCVTRATERLGWTEPGCAERIERVCAAHGLPTDTSVSHEDILRFATHDKKRSGQTVNLIVPLRIGKVAIRTVDMDELARIVSLGCGTR